MTSFFRRAAILSSLFAIILEYFPFSLVSKQDPPLVLLISSNYVSKVETTKKAWESRIGAASAAWSETAVSDTSTFCSLRSAVWMRRDVFML